MFLLRIFFASCIFYIIYYFLADFAFRITFVQRCICAVGKFAVTVALTIVLSMLARCYYERKGNRAKVSPQGKAVLITGCDTGFGFETALRLYCSGYQVYAGCLQLHVNGALTLAKVDGAKRLIPVALDVSDQSQVDEAYQIIASQLKNHQLELWAVINNAGLCSFGELEFCGMDSYQRVIGTNTLGTVRVTKAFIPLLRRSRGRLIFISSLAGLLSYPGLTAYCMSKHANAALADVLRAELRKWNISVITVEATGYRTHMLNQARIRREMDFNWYSTPQSVRDTYGEEYFAKFQEVYLKRLISVSTNIGEAVDTIVETVESLHVKNRHFTSIWAKVRALGRFLPPSLQDAYMSAFESIEPRFKYFTKRCSHDSTLQSAQLMENVILQEGDKNEFDDLSDTLIGKHLSHDDEKRS